MISNKKFYTSFSINGVNAEHQFGRKEFNELLRDILLWGRAMESHGLSSFNIQFSVNELTRTAADVAPNDFDAQLIAMIGIDNIEIATPEMQAEIDLAISKQKHPMYLTWMRGSNKVSGARFRDTLLPGEWDAVCATARTLWPDDYESSKDYIR